MKASKEKPTKQNFITNYIKHLIAIRNYLTKKINVTKEENQESCHLYKNINKLIKKEREEHRIKVIEKSSFEPGA